MRIGPCRNLGWTSLVITAFFLLSLRPFQARTPRVAPPTGRAQRLGAVAAGPFAVPQGPLFLVPDDVDEADLGNTIPIHNYADRRLVVVEHPSKLPTGIRNRLTAIDDPATLTYRSWKGPVPPLSTGDLAGLPDGYYLLGLVGPEDSSWETQLAQYGVKKVDVAWPYGLVVHANGTQLLAAASSVTTSYGYSVIRGVLPVPLETRMSGELLRVVKGEQKLGSIPNLQRDPKGEAVVRLFFFNDSSPDARPLDHRAQELAELKKFARIPGSALAYGYDDAVLVGGAQELVRILQEVPSVAYAEALHQRQTDDHAQVYYPIAMSVAPPLYATTPIQLKAPVQPKVMPEEEIPPWVNGKDKPGPQIGVKPGRSVLQSKPGTRAMPSPIANFEGLGYNYSGFSMTGAPPDTEGDVGTNDYVQWVNSMFAVFDKSTGGVLYGPANGNTLFANLGGRCASDNNGDPLVMYDRIADRWFMSQFAVSKSPYYQCIAVSNTNDPVTTTWNLYAFSYGSNFNDYGKSGVWPDGYYMMFHMFANGQTWAGTEVCAFDRVKMLAGQVATQQCFGPNASYGGLLPSNFQGSTLPPAGSPNYFVAYGTNQLLFWPFHVDWTTTANTTFPFNSPTSIPVASFTEACGGSGGTCVPQPGTTNTLDTLGDRLMWRSNYRNFGDHESLVFCHTVTGGAGAGIRWYELRGLSTTPTVYQQGTYAPSDTIWRWMGSVNMDKEGDIAAGYSASSSSLHPSLYYTGRLSTDALGTLGQGEATLFSGSGSQTGSLTRWGDYSTMSVDPTDDCTFWYTNEYLASDGTFNWKTRICSFKFGSCNACVTPEAPTGLSASVPGDNEIDLSWSAGGNTYNVYRTNGSCPGSGYTLLASGLTSLAYSDTTVSGGTTYSYEVTAVDSTGGCESAASNCDSAIATGACTAAPTFAGLSSVTNPASATCELDLAWSAATPNCGTSITYNVYRSTSSSFTPSASNLIATGVTSTAYGDTNALADGSTYYYIVRAVDGSMGVEDANTVIQAGAPTGPQIRAIDETFEEPGGEPTSGGSWAHKATQGTDYWGQSTSGNPHGGSYTFFCRDVGSTNDDALVTPIFTVPANGTLSFWHTYNLESYADYGGTSSTGFDGAVLEISTDGGSTWNDLGGDITQGGYNSTISSNYGSPIAGRSAWSGGTIGAETEVVVSLSGYVGQNAQIRFRLACDNSTADTGWYIDDVVVSGDMACATAGAVKPVPDGKWVSGTAMRAAKAALDGSIVNLTWDVSTCQDANYNLYYGNGSDVSTYALQGSDCGLGNSGSATWSAPAIPAGEHFIWWVIAGTDGVQTESSWGRDSSGNERHPAASNQCGFTAKSTATSCP